MSQPERHRSLSAEFSVELRSLLAESGVCRATTTRWLAIHLPCLALEINSRAVRTLAPLVISDDAPQPCVLMCDQQARRKGVCIGLSLSTAYALCPELVVTQHDAQAEQQTLTHIADWAGQFTSMVSLTASRTLLLEIGGSERLFGGLKPLLYRIKAGLDELGYNSRFAVTPTPLSASLLAQAGIERIITGFSSLSSRLEDVRIEQCALAGKTIRSLQKMGVEYLADCYRLPREGLARRFGVEVLVFLDQVIGRAPDPRQVHVPARHYRNSLSLPDAIDSTEPLLFAAQRLVLELAGLLRSTDCAIQHFCLQLFHHRADPTVIDVRMLRAERDGSHFQSLLKEQVQTVRLPEAVERIELCASRFMAYTPPEVDLFGGRAEMDDDWLALMEKLQARLGRHAVKTLATAEEHRPEYQGVTTAPSQQNRALSGRHLPHAHRPLWLLEEPVLLQSRLGTPWYRGALLLTSGCERIETGWWDGMDVCRDYFKATNQGGESFWVFRERRHPAHWYLQGVFG